MDGRVAQMLRRWADYRNSLLTVGTLDSQFLELHELQDESNPHYVAEVVSLFLTDTEQLLHDLHRELTQQNVDFRRVDVYVNRIEGQSCSVGAPRLRDACIAFRDSRDLHRETTTRAYLRCLEEMRQEFFLVKSKLEILLGLERLIVAAGGTIPRSSL